MIPRRAGAGEAAEALALIRAEFAYMDGVIDPPSSMLRLGVADLEAGPGELWVMGTPLVACVVLTAKGNVLYVGKLAVAASARGRGLARALIDRAAARAADLGLAALELQTRVELCANHAAFGAMGFAEVGRTAHEGYDRATSVTYRRAVPEGGR